MRENVKANVLWLKNNFGEKLVAKIAGEGESLSFESAIRIFMAADPSENKKALDWLVKNYLSTSAAFRWEDIRDNSTSMVCETLKLFGEHRNKLTGNARNLQEYRSIAEVWRSIQEFVKVTPEISGKEIKRHERLAALKESLIVYQDSQQILAVPLTQSAAQWWGRGTRWCTSAKENNYFDNYNQNSPLIVLVVPNGITAGAGVDKFQIWVTDESIQFMDSVDAEVRPELVAENWVIFKPLLEWALQRNLDALKWFPISAYSQEWSLELVEQSAYNFKFIPDQFKTKEMCWLALNDSPHHFSNIPDHLIDKNMCDIAVNYSIDILPRIPERFLDEDWLINHIQNQNTSKCIYLYNIPEKFRTLAVKKALLASDPLNFNKFPFSDQTRELFDFIFPNIIVLLSEHSYESDDFVLDSINPLIWSKEKLIKIIELSPNHISYLPPKVLDEELYCLAIAKGATINGIPEKFITPSIARVAVEAYPHNIGYIPDKFVTEELKEIAFKKDCQVVWRNQHVTYPDQFYMQALEKDWSMSYLLPPHLRTFDVYKKSIAHTPNVIALIRTDELSIELIEYAMNINGSNGLDYILYDLKYRPELLQFIVDHPKLTDKLLRSIKEFSDHNALNLKLDRFEPKPPKETSVNWSVEVIQELKDRFVSTPDQTHGLK